jgi:hypothetical protein
VQDWSILLQTNAATESNKDAAMPRPALITVFISLLFTLAAAARADDAAIEAELDAYWKSVSAYLAAGDYEGVVSTYHPDAVLVSERLGTSYPITRALARWKPGIMETAAGKAFSFVEFRITRRLFSDTTAHEQGIFHFRSGPLGSDADEADIAEDWVHFEALLLKDEQWTMVMEYQKHPATAEEWAAAE